MNPPPYHHGGETQSPPLPSPARRELQLQGPRPSPLKVNKDSHKIRKPPPHPRPPPSAAAAAAGEFLRQEPVIIYTVSPKVIHATVTDFMSIVQRLTGPSSSAATDGQPSPAARLAAMEKTSPLSDTKHSNISNTKNDEFLMGLGDFDGVGHFPGILSPGPATLAPIPAGFFSPAMDPQQNQLLAQDLNSPFWHNVFMASPSSLLVSPTNHNSSFSSSSLDFFNLFD